MDACDLALVIALDGDDAAMIGATLAVLATDKVELSLLLLLLLRLLFVGDITA